MVPKAYITGCSYPRIGNEHDRDIGRPSNDLN